MAAASDWKLVYSEKFASKQEALIREKEIKNKKSRCYIEVLIILTRFQNYDLENDLFLV